MARKLTAKDAREVTGYSREELRALLTRIDFHGGHPVQARVALEFTPGDLIVLAAVRELELTCGMSRASVARILKPLKTALSRPRPVNRHARLVVTLAPVAVTYVDASSVVGEGVVVALRRVFDRVDAHLGVYTASARAQGDLKFAPGVVRQRKLSRSGS